MKFKQPTIAIMAFSAIIALIAACSGSKNYFYKKGTKVENDCSAVFETRYPQGKPQEKKHVNQAQEMDAEEKPVTECKVLEVKIDKDTKCEIVGSDKIDNLKDTLSEHIGDRIVFVAPEKKFRDITQAGYKYLMSYGIDARKHIDSDVFKGFNAFPYKGMRCVVADKKFVIWSGDNSIIFTMQD